MSKGKNDKFNVVACFSLFLTVGFILVNTFFPESVYSLEKTKLHKAITQNISEFQVYDSFNCLIYYCDKDYEYLETVARAIDFYLPLLKEDFNLEEVPKIKVVIYSSMSDMSEALGINVDTKYYDAPMGVYYGGYISVLSPREWIFENDEVIFNERFVKEGPIIHELSHYLTDIKSSGNYEIWFTEGIALFYENKYTGFEWRSDLKKESQVITLAELKADFSALDESLAYRRCFDIVNNYVLVHGENQLQNLILGDK